MKQGCIFLIGLMGSGKTTVGRTLASRLNAVFTDTDEMIEAQAGISISEIFEKYGENHFRDLETGLLQQLADESSGVETGLIRQMADQRRREDAIPKRQEAPGGSGDPDGWTIISVGGGLPLRKENRELMRALGTTVFLYASEETLEKRLRGDTSRPLIQGGDLVERIRALTRARLAVYEEAADIRVKVDERKPEEIAEEIIRLVCR